MWPSGSSTTAFGVASVDAATVMVPSLSSASSSCSSVTAGSVVQMIDVEASPGNDGMICTEVFGAYTSPRWDTVARGWAIRPCTANRSVCTMSTPGPPMPGPCTRKKLVSSGLPTTWCSTFGSPTYPAGAAGETSGSQRRKGPMRPFKEASKPQGGERQPVSSVIRTWPSSSATSVSTPYGEVIVYVASGTASSMRIRRRWKATC